MGPFTSIGICLLYLSFAKTQDWQKPYFLDPHTEGVVFGEFNKVQPIEMDEELPVPIKLAIINYDGDLKPAIGSFQTGNFNSLNASIERSNSEWFIQVNSRQDYETPAQQMYDFTVVIGPDSYFISLLIQNIFDNEPTITYEGPCVAEELKENYNTNCKFNVYAADGLDGNHIELKFVGRNGEEDLFDFRNNITIDSYRMEFTLFVKKELRYEQRALYSFRTYVYDIVRHNASIPTIIEVIDMPSLPPVWVTPFGTATFKEKTEQNYVVEAIDGDTGIDKKIWYKLLFNEDENYSALMSIDKVSGALHINPIDRDTLQREVFTFQIYAYKFDNETWGIQSTAVIIVEDINDHLPELSISPMTVQFKEATYLTVPIDFTVNDQDLGDHATYGIILSQNDIIIYSQAFTVIPNSGYQEATFTLTVNNASLLDYEEPDWRTFDLVITASETKFPENQTQRNLKIELINWNDEVPIFTKDVYSASINETAGADEFIAEVRAFDRDIGDEVIHEIVGGLRDLSIDKDGNITTLSPDVFDYERQTTVIIQIKATDTLQTYPGEKSNFAFAQLTINVLDINDETPEIRMPRKSPNITENSPEGTVVTTLIQATDPDTTADLFFEINWADSYATKSGQDADKDSYENCFIMETHPETINLVYGHLIVNPEFNQKIDYEMYEVIYLAIRVTDRNQTVNEDSVDGFITIRVDDVNDNAPRFIHDTLFTTRNVVEEALPGTLVGTILAEDIDGPGNNNVSYYIQPKFGSQTPNNLILIEPLTGALRVMENAIIDCDQPRIDNLEYTIIITDGELPEFGDINIGVIDINNKVPAVTPFDNPIELFENCTTGDIVGQVSAIDYDRDEPHNKLQYMINYPQFPELRKYFEINVTSGLIKIKLQGDSVLDRDNGPVKHEIHVNIEDNYQGNGRINQNKTSLTLILLDVNDQKPEMPKPKDFNPIVPENSEQGTLVGPEFIAIDRDEEDTPNSWVSYVIRNIQPAEDNPHPNSDAENLFIIVGDDKVFGQLIANKGLKGYHGTWLVTIEAYDHGDEGPSREVQRSQETYNITVTPFNFNAPKIVYPTKDDVLRLRFEGQEIGKPLYMTDMTILPSFEAEDPDGGDFGNIIFEISSYNSQSGDADCFEMIKESRQKSRFQLKQNISAKIYQLNVKAIDGGYKSSEELTKLVVVFVDMKGEPVFENPEFTTDFTENEEGLEETRIIPMARDPKNEGMQDPNEMFPVYYFIDSKYNPTDAALFQLDKEHRTLTLTEMLDREKIDKHELRIFTTNQKDGQVQSLNENSLLLVHITVNDVNDNPPEFEKDSYGGGITPSDYTTKPILTVTAHDPDLNDSITYSFDADSIRTSGENIENLKKNMFSLDNKTGVISLTMVPNTNMKGYYEFQVQAADEVMHTDHCTVKIFIVSEDNRVSFIFLSSYNTIAENVDFLSDSFKMLYGYDECNIDSYNDMPYTESRSEDETTGPKETGMTNVRAHFIHNNEAVPATDIRVKSNDLKFKAKLQNVLGEKGLILYDLPTETTENETENKEGMLTTVLIVVSVVLGTLCIVLIAAFVLKTRKLNRQMNAFSTPDFGSTSSNLNRREAPTTNVFSVEGSNPVLNNSDLTKDAFDNMSVESYESDFVGINNDPTFINDHEESKNYALAAGIENNYRNSLQSEIYKDNGAVRY